VQGTPLALPHWAAPVLAFAAFGGLVGWRIGASPLSTASGLVVGAAFAFAATYLLVGAITLAHPGLGREAVLEAASTGLLLLLPFAVLALVAELILGWNASQTFSSAGLMTACGAVGVEVSRRGGGTLRSMLVPTAIAVALAAAWMILSTFAAANWKW
jgi:uncharacterized membrane protein (UPF0136 family)